MYGKFTNMEADRLKHYHENKCHAGSIPCEEHLTQEFSILKLCNYHKSMLVA